MDLTVYATLFVTCTVYAVLLHRYARLYADGWTWVTVVVGVALCMVAAWINMRLTGADGFASVVVALVVGGTPIVAWQLWRRFWLWPRQARRRGGD